MTRTAAGFREERTRRRIDELIRQMNAEDRNWKWKAPVVKEDEVWMWWEYLEEMNGDQGKAYFRLVYDKATGWFTVYDVTQPSVRNVIGHTGIKRATVIRDYAFTITTRQDRTPAQVIDCGGGRYRYLTERECWRLQGYTDEDFENAKAVQKRKGRYYTALYHQAGNSIAVPIFESIFRKIIKGETA